MKHKRFTKEFKLEAVRLLENGNEPPADIARELGIRRNQRYKWKEELEAHGQDAFAGATSSCGEG